jgi:hypothetical protein
LLEKRKFARHWNPKVCCVTETPGSLQREWTLTGNLASEFCMICEALLRENWSDPPRRRQNDRVMADFDLGIFRGTGSSTSPIQ